MFISRSSHALARTSTSATPLRPPVTSTVLSCSAPRRRTPPPALHRLVFPLVRGTYPISMVALRLEIGDIDLVEQFAFGRNVRRERSSPKRLVPRLVRDLRRPPEDRLVRDSRARELSPEHGRDAHPL